jgi:predicted transposase YdaD
MLEWPDIRQTRVYQEAKEEGRKEGIELGLKIGIEIDIERERSFQQKLRSLAKMAAMNMAAETIADLLGLDVDFVRMEMAKNPA